LHHGFTELNIYYFGLKLLLYKVSIRWTEKNNK